jgi:hypothetical protein
VQKTYQSYDTRVITTDGSGTLGTSFSPESVMSAIQAAGAFGAALAATPNITQGDEPVRCGFGGGTFSSTYAGSFGCAVKAGSVYFNVAAAYTPPVTLETVGDVNGFGGRLGFSFPLGKTAKAKAKPKVTEPVKEELIALAKTNQTESKELREDLSKTKEELEKIRKENEKLRNDRKQQMSLLQMLSERVAMLERLMKKVKDL